MDTPPAGSGLVHGPASAWAALLVSWTVAACAGSSAGHQGQGDGSGAAAGGTTGGAGTGGTPDRAAAPVDAAGGAGGGAPDGPRGTGGVGGAPGTGGTAARPNIIVILADDMGFEVSGTYGGRTYQTPNIDRMAAAGTRFDLAFATPLCSPSRATMITGRYPFRTGWTDIQTRLPGNPSLDPAKEPSVARVLKGAGYATGIAGKWHLSPGGAAMWPSARASGFDEGMIINQSASRYWNPEVYLDGVRMTGVESRFGPDLISEWAIAFVRRHKASPFFLYYPNVLVHVPIVAPPGYASASFANMVRYLDKLVGDLLAAVDAEGLGARTLVLFTGDNGTDDWMTDLAGRTVTGQKARLTDLGTHVALVARWTGVVPAGATRPDLVDFSDFLPTLAELAGTPLPSGVTLDGRSFAPALHGLPGRPRDWAYSELRGAGANADSGSFVRERAWKLAENGNLYDMSDAPYTEKLVPRSGAPAAAVEARQRLEPAMNALRAGMNPGFLPNP